jgi:hypothetical protein
VVKVSELTRERRPRLSPLQEQVLRFLEARSDELSSYRDEGLAKRLGIKPSALSFSLWALEKQGLIEKETVKGKVYFGSAAAITELRDRLGLVKEDPLDRALSLRDRIWARTGDIDVIELLDAVRGPWD